ncbi:MAG: hypothetical protein US30_C0020G0002 [Candidatus Moranbacteria bacterium GW2011_GWF2_36_839]|nr:MAG: hypothetical protein US27_C0021G0002 [Candidatus Moranbacteria bacterium GW2011_GWF1_36_78]KKQ16278.1 MAG: hypothetical protein US30_C0020G0002 [Candidatus Moranbacteria bacterium GW2011_GWF2_36_839]
MLRNKISNKKMKDKNTRKLTRVGKRSLGITLPAEEVRELGWKEKQKLIVKKVRGGFLVKDWRR